MTGSTEKPNFPHIVNAVTNMTPHKQFSLRYVKGGLLGTGVFFNGLASASAFR